MFCKVIPVRRMPRQLDYLIYALPKNLQTQAKVGQLVEIPLQKHAIFGLISEIGDKLIDKAKNIKAVNKIIFNEPAISKEQLAFLLEMSDFYGVSPGILVKMNLLPLKKTKLAKVEIEKSKDTSSVGLMKRPSAYTYLTEQDLYNYLKKNSPYKKQILVIVPETKMIDGIAINKECEKITARISSEIKEKDFFQLWLDIRNKKKNIIIGTRSALFLPFTNLREIFMVDESNPSYKSWDQSPLYHTRDAIFFLAKSHSASVHLLSHTPSVETYYFSMAGLYNSNTRDIKKLPALPAKIKIINMLEERKKRNYGFMSEDIIDAIQKNATVGDIFVMLNKRGFASCVGCRDCGFILKCEQCKKPLTFHEPTNCLICHYCSKELKIQRRCENCGGVNLAMRGIGTQQVQNEIKKIFKQSKKPEILRIDSDDKKEINNLDNDGRKIIIGTQMAWRFIDWKKISLVVFLDADSSLFIPEYKVSENLFYRIRDAQFRLTSTSSLIIQTSHPDNPVFKGISDPKKFYHSELTDRRAFGYPPYKYLIRIFGGFSDKISSEKEAKNVHSRLINLTKGNNFINITDYLPCSPFFMKNKYWHFILIKIDYKKYKSMAKMISSNLSNDWKIDPNPNNLLTIK
ncbi:MAG: primosomal protein N' [bacterium]